jgi:HK97 family phage portal protein
VIFDKLSKREAGNREFDWSSWIKGDDYVSENSLKEQNYLNALNFLSNTIGSLPISIKQTTENGEIEASNHYLWDLLRLRPNSNMNAFECKKALIMMYKHYGLAGLFIERDYNGNTTALYPVRIDQFTVDDAGLIESKMNNKVLVDFTCLSGEQGSYQGSCFDKDIIILRDNSLDGIHGRASRRYLKQTIDTNLKAQSYQNDLFSNGLTSKAVVQMTSSLKEGESLKKVQTKFDKLYGQKGRILTIPVGFNVQPLNLSLVDSQFSELKVSGKRDIAAMIGIPFNALETGVLTDADRVSYLTNTVIPLLTALEQEFDWKVLGLDRRKGYKVRFNVNSLLRTSPETQKNIICDYAKNGVYSIEYARDVLGIDYDFENETVTLPSGQVLLSDLKAGVVSYQRKFVNDTKNSNDEGGDGKNDNE